MRTRLMTVGSTLALFAVISSFALVSSDPVSAQTQKSPFKPAQSWSVGATQLANAGSAGAMKLPCVLSNEYDNGYIVRLSGGGGDMLALAIDFRQDVFTQGRKYNALISLGDDYSKQVVATAFTTNTLIFNLRPLSGLYDRIKKNKTMTLSIDSNTLSFSLGDISAAFTPLEECYNGKTTAFVKPMLAGGKVASRTPPSQRPVLVPSVQKAANTQRPKTFDDILGGTAPAPSADMAQSAPVPLVDAAPVTAQNTHNEAAPSSLPSRISKANAEPASETRRPLEMPGQSYVSKQSERTQQTRNNAQQDAVRWRASAGEDLKTVLARWAQSAGYDLDWQSRQGGKVAQDVSINGTFEQAVSQLLAENGAAEGIAAHIEDEGSKSSISSQVSDRQWSANKGDDLETVLRAWAGAGGVDFVWKGRSAKVLSSIKQDGSFENAVQSLLDQYQDERSRPVGQLNLDPDTGRKTLMIETDNSAKG